MGRRGRKVWRRKRISGLLAWQSVKLKRFRGTLKPGVCSFNTAGIGNSFLPDLFIVMKYDPKRGKNAN
jgi:hypothetical protein